MVDISIENYQNGRVYNIMDKGKTLWLRNKDTGKKLGVENIYDLIDKEIKDKIGTNNLTE